MNINQFEIMIKAGAVGDAFGYQVEFNSWKEIQAIYGAEGLVDPPEKTIFISDDTQMTLFSVEASMATWKDGKVQDKTKWLDDQKIAFLNWFETQNQIKPGGQKQGLMAHEIMFRRQAPGMTCLRALRDMSMGCQVSNDSKGCGAIMRVGGSVLLNVMGQSPQDVWDAASKQAYVTHLHHDAVVSSGVFAYLLARSPVNKMELEQVLRQEIIPKLEGSQASGTIKAIESALQWKDESLSPLEMKKRLGQGWTGDEALAVALWSVFQSQSLFHAVTLATNHDGDSDSTATLAAQLASLMHPWDASCERTFQKLDAKEVILKILNEASLSVGNCQKEDKSKPAFLKRVK